MRMHLRFLRIPWCTYENVVDHTNALTTRKERVLVVDQESVFVLENQKYEMPLTVGAGRA